MHPIIALCYLSLMVTFIGGFLLFACDSLSQWRADRRAELEALRAIDAAQFRRDAVARDFFNIR